MPAIRGATDSGRFDPYSSPLRSSQCVKKWMVDGVSEDRVALVYRSLLLYVPHQKIQSIQTQSELVVLVQSVLRMHHSRTDDVQPLNLSGLNLANGHWEDVAFQNVKLSGTSFKGGVFNNVSFRNCEMNHTRFQLSSFCNGRIANTKMAYVNFDFCVFKQVQIVNSDLQSTQCEGALWQVDLSVHGLGLDFVNTIEPSNTFPPTHVLPHHNQLIECLPHYLNCRNHLIHPAVRFHFTTLLGKALCELSLESELAFKNSEAVRLLKKMDSLLPAASKEDVDDSFKQPTKFSLLSGLVSPLGFLRGDAPTILTPP